MSGTAHKPQILQQANAILGEGPIWHPEERALYWIDILRPAAYRHVLGEGQTGNWTMPSAIGAMGFCKDARLIVATENEGISLFDMHSGSLEPLLHPAVGRSGRFNDGRVDAAGRFWVGWLTHERKTPGALLRISPSGECEAVLQDITASNGLGWSADQRTMYVTDSHINVIWAYDFDLEAGRLGARRALVRQERSLGIFDGLSVDMDGCVWTTLYGGGAVLRLSPEGAELERHPFPVRLTTSCTFGGADLSTLFVTSAVRDQTAGELLAQPDAGALMSISVSTAGLREHRFG